MAFSVVDRLCYKIKGKGHCVYMDRWFSSPQIFNHLWACKTRAVGRVTSKRKKISGKVKKAPQKKIMPTGSPLGHQVEGHL
jgi:hypothetical protein